jgi:hypothetical protein
MARPIKETPILEGKDATQFLNNMQNVQKSSKSEMERIQKSYQSFKSIAKFEC